MTTTNISKDKKGIVTREIYRNKKTLIPTRVDIKSISHYNKNGNKIKKG